MKSAIRGTTLAVPGTLASAGGLAAHPGHIAEGGSHAELLRQRGHYYRLYTQQFRHQLEVQYGVAEEEVISEKEEVLSEAAD